MGKARRSEGINGNNRDPGRAVEISQIHLN